MSSLPSTDLAFRKWLSSRLDPFKALDSDHELYVAINEGTEHDPIKYISRDICLSETDSLNFISGFSGSGKSTELQRLKKDLSARGFFVAIADASDYFLPTRPVDFDILLITLAGAYSDQIETIEGIDPSHQSYWQRLWHWLSKTDVKIEGFEFNLTIPKTDLGLKFKALLKEDTSFIDSIKKLRDASRGELRRMVREFFAAATLMVRQKYGAALSPVFIFDSFEKLHDIPQTEGSVADSISTLISNHQSELKIPGHHLVLTMPPWIGLLPQGPQNIRLIYGVKLWENTPDRRPHKEGFQQMRAIVEKRFTSAGLDRFFGPARKNGHRPLVDQLILASGGHLRDLIRLLRETLIRVEETRVDPAAPMATKANVTSAIDSHRDSFSRLSDAHAVCLMKFAQDRRCSFPDTKHETIHAITALLNGHYAFLQRNTVEWCDIHPLLREFVADFIIKSAVAAAAQPPPTA